MASLSHINGLNELTADEIALWRQSETVLEWDRSENLFSKTEEILGCSSSFTAG